MTPGFLPCSNYRFIGNTRQYMISFNLLHILHIANEGNSFLYIAKTYRNMEKLEIKLLNTVHKETRVLSSWKYWYLIEFVLVCFCMLNIEVSWVWGWGGVVDMMLQVTNTLIRLKPGNAAKKPNKAIS